MVIEKTVKMTNRGMIVIPAAIRKQFDLKDGDQLVIASDDKTHSITLVPVETIESLRAKSFTTKEALELMKSSRKIELGLEK